MKKLLSPWKVFFVVWSETLFQNHRHPKSKVQKPNTDVSHSVSTDVTHLMRPLDQSSHTPFHLKYHFEKSCQPDEVLRIWRKNDSLFLLSPGSDSSICGTVTRMAGIARNCKPKRYIDTLLGLMVAIYIHMEDFGQKKCFLGSKIYNYAQKRRIGRENSKYATDKNFCSHFCARQKAATLVCVSNDYDRLYIGSYPIHP